MPEPLLPSRLLFRFAAPCHYRAEDWSADAGKLPDEFRLPDFCQLEDQTPWADVRCAWNERGLSLWVQVAGKRLPARCDRLRPAECDGLRAWIDTRATHNIHRASRFCHQFAFLPFGEGRRGDHPVTAQLLINRAKENARRADPAHLHVASQKRLDGYILAAHIAADALTGFDPAEHPQLGFTYLVSDAELGEQTFSCSGEFPFHDDPSLWATLDLVGGEA